jgi:hypothetical protein
MNKTIRVFKLTTENWHPSYALDGYYKGHKNNQLVEVSLLHPLSDGRTRVCIWGGDDTAMERDFNSYPAAKKMFNKVIAQEFVNRAFLKQNKFSFV